MNDDDDCIICQRISGRSVRASAAARRTTVSAINEAIDRWARIERPINGPGA
jgi:hypothetical protein